MSKFFFEHVKVVCMDKRYIVLFLMPWFFFVGFFQSLVMGEEPGSATLAVKETINQVLEVLDNESDDGRRLVMLESVISKRFDYEEMGRRALGRHWSELNPRQHKEFVELFHALLFHAYATHVRAPADLKVEYVKELRKKNFAEVRTKIISKNHTLNVPLNYRLLLKTNDWKVYDVIVDGISVVKNYRSQFQRIIKTSGYEGLLVKLESKVAMNLGK